MTDQELKDLVTSLAIRQVATAIAQDRTDAQLRETGAQLRATDAQLKANALQMAETDRKLDRASVLLGNIGQNQGAVAEEFFFNSLQAKPILGGVQYEEVIQNAKSINGKLQGEYDVVMVNGKSVALIEVKYAVHANDITKTINGIGNYRSLFPQHKDFDIYGAIAGFKISPEVVELAKEQGLMVLKRVGDVLEVDAGRVQRF